MKDTRQSSVTIQGVTVTRAEAIHSLCFPASPLAQRSSTEGLTLPTIVRDNPSALEAVGLVQQEVYGAVCTDVERGSWDVRPRMIWVDQESGVPVDSATVMFIDSLPNSLSSAHPSDLIQFPPPTYCRNREDAERLVRLLEEAGPAHNWPFRAAR